MQVFYTYSIEPRPLHVYCDPARNTHELSRAEANAAAQRIGDRGGYAEVRWGGALLARYGSDPRDI